jgi:uncharacterized protein YndB with AHSA1/START domain
MNDAKFVYVIYIDAAPEKIWNALLDAKFTHEYWAHENVSDWKVGSDWEHRRADAAGTVDLVGEVIAYEPPKKLVLSWAAPADKNDRARHTRVAIELQPVDSMVRLTVTHDEFEHAPEMLERISGGWPRVLSSLKSLLETGRPLPTWATGECKTTS